MIEIKLQTGDRFTSSENISLDRAKKLLAEKSLRVICFSSDGYQRTSKIMFGDGDRLLVYSTLTEKRLPKIVRDIENRAKNGDPSIALLGALK